MSHSHPSKAAKSRLKPRKAPVQSRSARTVDAILEGAAHILERSGLEGYTTNAVAARAGVSIGSLYQYFPGKDAVTMALIERESSALAADVHAALALPDPGQAVQAMIRAAVRNQLRRPGLARLLDFEEARLASAMPPSGTAAAVRAAVTGFLQRAYGLPAAQSLTAAMDVMEVTCALTDAAGRRNEADPALLERAIEGAVTGYLGAVQEQGKAKRAPAAPPRSASGTR